MYDIHVIMRNIPGELAWLGSTLGEKGIGLEGGGLLALATTPMPIFLSRTAGVLGRCWSSHSWGYR